MFSNEMMMLFLKGLWETLYMTIVSTALAYLFGLPLGVLLCVTDKNGIKPNKPVNVIIGFIVNFLRSVPFLILLVALIPVTRAIVGTTIGSTAIIVPLVIGSTPFVARMVESSLQEVNAGVIEATKSMGATNFQIIKKVLIPEAKPSLLVGGAIAITTILGYSAMAGFVGGGGLGAIAINYGYYRFEPTIMYLMVIILAIIVQVFQEVGMKISKKYDKRIKNN